MEKSEEKPEAAPTAAAGEEDVESGKGSGSAENGGKDGEAAAPKPMVGTCELYRYADTCQMAMVVGGFFGSLVMGAIMPLFAIGACASADARCTARAGTPPSLLRATQCLET